MIHGAKIPIGQSRIRSNLTLVLVLGMTVAATVTATIAIVIAGGNNLHRSDAAIRYPEHNIF